MSTDRPKLGPELAGKLAGLSDLQQRLNAEALEPSRFSASIDRSVLMEVRGVLASTIAWLEGLHPTVSRSARLRALRDAHDKLAAALRGAP
jgi:hypothetical protein